MRPEGFTVECHRNGYPSSVVLLLGYSKTQTYTRLPLCLNKGVMGYQNELKLEFIDQDKAVLQEWGDKV